MKKIIWKRILPILMTAIMLFSAAAPTLAASVSAPDEERPYYTIEFVDGVLTVSLDAERVFYLLRDGKLSRDDLLNFIPEDVLATLEKGRDITLDDLRSLAAEYVTAEDLQRLKDIIPADIFREYFDISMLDGIVEINEILALIPIDDIIGGIDESKIKALINDDAWKILLNDTAKEKVLTKEFVSDILADGAVIESLLSDEKTRDALIGLIDDGVVSELIKGEGVTEALVGLVDDAVIAELIKGEGVTEKVIGLIDDKVIAELIKGEGVTQKLIDLIDDKVVSELIKGEGVTEALIELLDDEVVAELVKIDGVLDKLAHLIDEQVAHAMAENDTIRSNLIALVDEALVDKVMNDSVAGPRLVSLTESREFLDEILKEEHKSDLEKIKDYLVLHEANVSHFIEIDGVVHAVSSLDSVKQFLSDTVNVGEIDTTALDTDKFIAYATDASTGFIEEDDLKEKILNDDDHFGLDPVEYPLGTPAEQHETMQKLDGKSVAEIVALLEIAQIYEAYRSNVSVDDLIGEEIITESAIKDLLVKHWAEMLGADEHDSTELMRDVLDAVGLSAVFESFNQDEIIRELGGYTALFAKGYITNQQVIDAVGGYEKLIGFLIPEKEAELISAVGGYYAFLHYIPVERHGEIVTAVGGYGVIVNAIIAVGKQSDLVTAVGGYGNVADAILATGKQSNLVTAVGGYGKIANAIISTGKQSNLVTAVGGYSKITSVLISQGKQEELAKAVGGYSAIVNALLPEKLDKIVNIIGYGKLTEFVELDDIVAKAGGYASLLSWYTPTEIGAVVKAIGTDAIIEFAKESGIIQSLDVKKLASDILDLVRSKKDGMKSLVKVILTRISNIFLIEVEKAYLNGKQICSYGTLDMQATITALLQAIPTTNDILAMSSGDELASLLLTVALKDREPITVGVRFRLIGDLEDLQRLVSNRADEFNFEVGDEMDITSDVALPAVVASLYERALLSDRLPDRLKTKILEIPTMTVSDVSELLAGITDEEIASYAADVLSKIEEIRDKAYAKIDARFGNDNSKIELAKQKVERVLEIVSNADRLATLRDKAVEYIDRIASRLGDKTVNEFYSGSSVFEFNETFGFDFYEILSKKITVPEKLYLLFDNDMTVSGSLDLSLTVKDLYKITVIEEDGSIREFFLSEGTPLSILNERAGVAYEFEDGAVMGNADAMFVHKDVFMLEFYGRDGTLIERMTYSEGDEPDESQYPAIPQRSGYTSRWSVEDVGNNVFKATIVDTPIEYNAEYEYNGEIFDIGNITVETRSVKLPIPEKTGYTFDAWFVDVDGNGVFNEDAGDFKLVRRIVLNTLRTVGASQPQTYDFDVPDGKSFPAGDVKFIATFTLDIYEVTFINKGQTYGEPDEFHVHDMSITLPATNPVADTGYRFTGWLLDTNGDDIGDLALTATSTAPALKNYNAYANYEAIEYRATFSNGAVRTFTVEDDAIANIPEVPVLDGYRNGRWMVDVGNDENKQNDILLSEYVISAGDITVYAEYDVITYTVVFVSKGEQYATDTFDVTDRTVSLPATDPVADEGYRFVGWFIDTDGDGDLDERFTASYTLPLANVTVYAVFESTTYSAIFEAIPGTGFGGLTIQFEYGDTSLVGVPTIPQKVGYTTDGKWYVRGDGEDVPLDEFDLASATSDIRLYAKYTAIQYIAKYEHDGQIRDLGTVTVETRSVWLPIPMKAGYTFSAWYVDVDGNGAFNAEGGDFTLNRGITGGNQLTQFTLPEGKSFPATSIIIRSIFTINTYTATFSDGTVINFTVLDDELEGVPAVPARAGYKGAWYVELGDADLPLGEYELGPSNITVYAKYDAIKYKATFVVGDEIVATVEFTVEDEVIPNIPAVPEKLGYTGRWSDYVIGPADITVKAIYIPILYTATFTVNGEVFYVMTFTVEDTALSDIPAVPAKLGYTGVWSSYTLGVGNITIEAIYTINIYKATFVADGVTVAVVEFTVNDTAITEPAVPVKAGYVGAWEEYTLGAADIVINAIYTPEATPPAEDGGIPWWIWLIIIVLLIIIGILIFLLINRKRDDDESLPPEPTPVVVPEPEVEEAPVEEIHIDVVESVDVATADVLMSDETASHVVETVYGAGVGMKAIINVQDINDAFGADETVDIDALKAKKLIPAKAQRIKVLADGHLDKPLTVIAEGFSVQAIKMITLTGGKAIQKK